MGFHRDLDTGRQRRCSSNAGPKILLGEILLMDPFVTVMIALPWNSPRSIRPGIFPQARKLTAFAGMKALRGGFRLAEMAVVLLEDLAGSKLSAHLELGTGSW